MTEEWRDIKGFEGAYQVSNLGRVRSLDREYIGNDGHIKRYKSRIMTRTDAGKGYYIVMLQYKRKKSQQRVCRLVAEAFCPNPYGYTQVNHIDENKANDCADNLEWCTPVYNTNYGTGIQRRAKKICVPVNQYTLEGIFVRRWDSITEAQNYYGSELHISACCRNKLTQTGGYKWEYAKNI